MAHHWNPADPANSSLQNTVSQDQPTRSVQGASTTSPETPSPAQGRAAAASGPLTSYPISDPAVSLPQVVPSTPPQGRGQVTLPRAASAVPLPSPRTLPPRVTLPNYPPPLPRTPVPYRTPLVIRLSESRSVRVVSFEDQRCSPPRPKPRPGPKPSGLTLTPTRYRPAVPAKPRRQLGTNPSNNHWVPPAPRAVPLFSIPPCPTRAPPPPPLEAQNPSLVLPRSGNHSFAIEDFDTTTSMASDRQSHLLDPASTMGNDVLRHKAAAVKIAKEQEQAIHEKLRRNGDTIPEYDFLELIGKGGYGRVFKALDKKSKSMVALKVMDVDEHDFKAPTEDKDETIEVTLHEIKVLQQLKDSKARNVNAILDAFQMHSQLWIVSEYCPGGSLRTLMRGTGGKLEDRFIVPIARELAEALKAIHEAGIIHRDVKAANVMIHENGSLQVIDFGVAGVLETKLDKRTTVIGTPHWMAPELHKAIGREGLNYGTEVDVWAYGCTLYEIATGSPPYPRTQPGRKLAVQLGRQPPRLGDSPEYSDGLKDLVACVLESKPAIRPSMEAILEHPYVKDSEITHPTESLAELVKTFYRWEYSGGQRTSLFFEGGAAAAQFPNTLETEEDWNFSTTAGFDQQFTKINPDQKTTSELVSTLSQHNIEASDIASATANSSNYLLHRKDSTPHLSPGFDFNMSDKNFNPHPPTDAAPVNTEFKAHKSTEAMTPQEKANAEARIKRGESALQGLFDDKKEPYQYGPKTKHEEPKPTRTLTRARSDLPLRDDNSESSIHHKELIITHKSDGTMELPDIDLVDTNTIKPGGILKFLGTNDDEGYDDAGSQYGQQSNADKRATMDWKFPSQPEVTVTDADDMTGAARDERRDTIAWTFPAEAMAPSEGARDNKRDTAAWTFPTEAMAPEINNDDADVDNPTPMQTRPSLRHLATAPAATDLRQSVGGVLDLDALYDSEPYDSDHYATDAFRSMPTSDDEVFFHQPAPSDEEVFSHQRTTSNNEIFPQQPPTSNDEVLAHQQITSDNEVFSHGPTADLQTPVVSNDETASPDTLAQPDTASLTDSDVTEQPDTASLADSDATVHPDTFTDSDDEYYDPFKGKRTSNDKLKDEINAYLDKQGVTDVMERAALRGKYMRARKGLAGFLARDQEDGGLGAFKARDWSPPLGQYGGRVLGKHTWDRYDPGSNLAGEHVSYPMGEPARLGELDFPTPGPPQTTVGPYQGNGATSLPDVQPPSAAAMRQDAPPNVVEGELRRLLVDFDGTLGALGDFFDGHAANLGGGAGENGSRG